MQGPVWGSTESTDAVLLDGGSFAPIAAEGRSHQELSYSNRAFNLGRITAGSIADRPENWLLCRPELTWSTSEFRCPVLRRRYRRKGLPIDP